jgi:hypothetical protein
LSYEDNYSKKEKSKIKKQYLIKNLEPKKNKGTVKNEIIKEL